MSTSSDFSVEVVHEGDDTVLAITGEIDLATEPELWWNIDRAMADADRVILDLSGTTFMDSTGLNAIIRATQHYGNDAIVVRAPQERVMRVFLITGLARTLNIVPATDAATINP
jgi:anti-sigma B factor antagonist